MSELSCIIKKFDVDFLVIVTQTHCRCQHKFLGYHNCSTIFVKDLKVVEINTLIKFIIFTNNDLLV